MLREPLRDMWLLSLNTNCWSEINVDLTHAPPPAWWLKSNILVMVQGLIVTFVGEKTGNSQRESKVRLEMYVIDCNNIQDSLSCEWLRHEPSAHDLVLDGEYVVCGAGNKLVLLRKGCQKTLYVSNQPTVRY